MLLRCRTTDTLSLGGSSLSLSPKHKNNNFNDENVGNQRTTNNKHAHNIIDLLLFGTGHMIC